MAKKKVEKPEADEKRQPVRVDLDPETHKMLRVVAAEAGLSMSAFARQLVEQTVRERYGKRGR
jgi:plasmid stability protein